MEKFESSCFQKLKQTLNCCPEKTERSSSSNSWLPRINSKAFFTAICIPIFAVVFDLVYSDTMVIWKLIQFTIKILSYTNNSTNVNLHNITDKEIEAAGSSVIMMMIVLVLIYMLSIAGLLNSPFVSSLKTSYQISILLQKEGVNMSTPVGQSQYLNSILRKLLIFFVYRFINKI